MTIEALLQEIRLLPVKDRKRLISLIVDTLPEDGEQAEMKRRSIAELRGLGEEIWAGIDAQAYVDQLRAVEE